VSCVSIVDALNELRRYVFITGGIGPDPDCVAKAFGVPINTIRARSPSRTNG